MSNIDLINDGVVSIYDPGSIEIEMRSIPGYPGFKASSLGVITRTSDNAFMRIRHRATTIGTYITTQVIDEGFVSRSVTVHRLVTLAFHGLPDSEDLEPDHDDGNKHNNLPGNLEWVTRGENIRRSYEIGLRKDNRQVTITDHEEGRVWTVYSLSEVGRQFGITKARVWALVTNHRERKYQDRYTFEVQFENLKTRRQDHIKQIMAMNYQTKELVSSDNTGSLEFITGVKRGTILWNLRDDRRTLINGWVFIYFDNKPKWPKYTQDEVEASIERHRNRVIHKPKRHGVVVYDYIRGEERTFKTLEQVATTFGLVRGTIEYLLGPQRNDLKLWRGLAFKTVGDERPFNEYPQELIKTSLRVKKPEFPMIKLTDRETNTIHYFASKTEVASWFGVATPSITNWFKLKDSTRAYRKRYWMEEVTV